MAEQARSLGRKIAEHRKETWNLMVGAEHRRETWNLMVGAEHRTGRLGT